MSAEFDKLFNYGFYFLPTNRNNEPAEINGQRWGVTKATRDKGDIRLWMNPATGFGLGCAGGKIEGSDKWLVHIDVDNKGTNGFEVFQGLQIEYGDLPKTLSISTPNKGMHYTYLSSKPIGSSTDPFEYKLKKPGGIDIKGINGYVVCPPAKGYTIIDDSPPAELPADWVLLLEALVCVHKKEKETYSIPPDRNVVKDYNAKHSVHSILIENGYKHCGNNFYQHPFGATSARNVAVLPNFNILAKGLGNEYVTYHFGAHDKVREGPHDAWDLTKILKFGGSHEEMRSSYEKHNQYEELEETISLGDVKRVDKTEMIDRHWEEGDIFMLAGESSTKKTFYILDAAMSMACGRPFLNNFKTRKSKSLMILTESREDLYPRREAWVRTRAKEWGVDPRELMEDITNNVFVRTIPLKLKNDQIDMDVVIPPKIRGQIQTLFVDHYASNAYGCGSTNENDNNEAARFINRLFKVVKKEHFATCLVHHTSMKTKNGYFRGATALHNGLPLTYFLEKMETIVDENDPEETEERIVVRQMKCSYGDGSFKAYKLGSLTIDLYLNPHYLEEGRMRTGHTVHFGGNYIKPPDEKTKQGRPESLTLEQMKKTMDYHDWPAQALADKYCVTLRTVQLKLSEGQAQEPPLFIKKKKGRSVEYCLNSAAVDLENNADTI